MKKLLSITLAVLYSLLLNSCAPVAERKTDEKTEKKEPPAFQIIKYKSEKEKLKDMLTDVKTGKIQLTVPNTVRIDTVMIDSVNKKNQCGF